MNLSSRWCLDLAWRATLKVLSAILGLCMLRCGNSQLTRGDVARAASFLCHHGDQVGWFDQIAKGHASLDYFVWEFCLRFVIKETG